MRTSETRTTLTTVCHVVELCTHRTEVGYEVHLGLKDISFVGMFFQDLERELFRTVLSKCPLQGLVKTVFELSVLPPSSVRIVGDTDVSLAVDVALDQVQAVTHRLCTYLASRSISWATTARVDGAKMSPAIHLHRLTKTLWSSSTFSRRLFRSTMPVVVLVVTGADAGVHAHVRVVEGVVDLPEFVPDLLQDLRVRHGGT